MKKIFIGIVIILIFVSLFIFIWVNKISTPFDSVYDFREDRVDDYKPIEIHDVDNGVMIYSVGKVNDGEDNMYFVDMVEKSLIGYKWLGGGGHINRDIGYGREFIFSAQLLNEEQNINPTIFGVFLDEEIKSIAVITRGESKKAIIIDRQSEGEKFYYVSLSNNVADNSSFIFEITYQNNEIVKYIISNNEIPDFQRGNNLFFYNE